RQGRRPRQGAAGLHVVLEEAMAGGDQADARERAQVRARRAREQGLSVPHQALPATQAQGERLAGLGFAARAAGAPKSARARSGTPRAAGSAMRRARNAAPARPTAESRKRTWISFHGEPAAGNGVASAVANRPARRDKAANARPRPAANTGR